MNTQQQHPLIVDVLVVGAGSAGVAAAVSAAEEGATTLLAEASAVVGGTLAGQLLEHSAGFHNVEGQQVVAGFGQRLISLMQRMGASPGHVRDDVGYTATRTPVNHTELMLAEAHCLEHAGVLLWLHSALVAVAPQGETTRCTFITPGGERQLLARRIIDTSGDAVAAQLAGSRFQTDGADNRQPVTLMFKLGGVQFAELMAWAAQHPEAFRPGSQIGSAHDAHVNLWGLGELLQQGYRDGLLSLQRNEMHIAGWPQRGELVVNVTRHASADPLDAQESGRAWLALSRQILEFARWFRSAVPGCAQAYVAATGNRVGIRETRRVKGRYTLTQQDVLQGARFTDSIACGGFPIDIHSALHASMEETAHVGPGYEISYRALVAAQPENLLVAGRCLSSDHQANGSARITGTCFATGEAAGVAAAMSLRASCPPSQLDTQALRQRLRERGAIVSLQDALTPATVE